MKNQSEIQQKVDELYEKSLHDRKVKYFDCTYLNCTSNNRHKVKKNGMVGFCTNQTICAMQKKRVVICNDKETACGCSEYKCKHTDESVNEDFNNILKNPARCGQEYPKLAVLIWVLQKDPKEKSKWGRFSVRVNVLIKTILELVLLKWR